MNSKRLPQQDQMLQRYYEQERRNKLNNMLYPAGDYFCANYQGLLEKGQGRVDAPSVPFKQKAPVI